MNIDCHDFVIAIIAGITASILYSVFIFLLNRFNKRRIFKPIAKEYIGFDKKEDKVKDNLHQSTASIKFSFDNRLTIKVRHGEKYENCWEGELIMTSKNHGIINYQYIDGNILHGYKRFKISNDRQEIYLIEEKIGENSRGINEEYFIRN